MPTSEVPGIIGYMRVASGCDFCIQAGERLYTTDDLMPIHEHCTCGVVPVFDDGQIALFHEPGAGAIEDGELGARLDQSGPAPQADLLDDVKIGGQGYDDYLAQGKMDAAMVEEYGEAVRAYAGHFEYEEVQAAFRFAGTKSERLVDPHALMARDKLIELFKVAPETTRDIRIYRGMSTKKPLKVGDTIKSEGLTSVSVDKGLARQFTEAIEEGNTPYVLRTTLPKGSKPINVDGNFKTKMIEEGGDPEGEFILGPNTKLKVVGESVDEDGYNVLEVELVD
jgi:hypothetical protein